MFISEKRFRVMLKYDFTKTMQVNAYKNNVTICFLINLLNDLVSEKYVTKIRENRRAVYALTEKGKKYIDKIKILYDIIY